MAGRLRGLAPAIALAAIISAGPVPESAEADSRSSTSINGRTITVVGGSSQSISSTAERTVVKLDGSRIVIRDGRIELEDAVRVVGDFTKLEIRARDGRIDIFVDGEPIDEAIE
ncbi:MAG TPA: hypothetical protein VGB88_06565 [Alphaproteobacteria bacterium]